jgi:hypothetical protein
MANWRVPQGPGGGKGSVRRVFGLFGFMAITWISLPENMALARTPKPNFEEA